MPRKKKETLVHLDLDTITKEMNTDETPLKTPNGRLTIGEALKNAREKKKLSLEEVSQKLRIKEVYLEALEKGHYYVFPGLSYASGFLRSYALFLGLDAKALLEEFHKETSEIKVEPTQMPIPKNSNLMPSFKTILNALIILLIVYLIWYIYISLTTPNMPQVTFEEETGELIAEPQTPQTASEIEAPAAETAPVVADSITQNAEAPVQMKVPETTPAPAPAVKTYGTAKTKGMALVATDEVWIRIMDDDGTVFERVLYPGDRYNLPERAEDLRIRTANAGALKVYVDNQPVRQLGEKGKFLNGFPLNIENFR